MSSSSKVVWWVLGIGLAYVFVRGLSNLNTTPTGTIGKPTTDASGVASAQIGNIG